MFITEGQELAVKDILKERERQIEKWGAYQNHDLPTWNTILMEEVGEFSQEILDFKFGGQKNFDKLREELVQTAAVALQIIECLDVDYAHLK